MLAAESLDLPETLAYRVKNKLLGPPLVNDRLSTERLGRPTALAVLSSDVLSSSSYASEQILTVLVPVIGVAAFSLVVPITCAVLVVLAFVTLSYREVIRAYPRAGGAYVVSRENFGPNVAQIAAAALLIDYTLTVAVSVAAGIDALVSIAPQMLSSYTVPMSVAAVLVMAYGNLRGIREAGRTFAVPTFFFLANMAVMIVVGLVRAGLGQLPVRSVQVAGALHLGHAGASIFLGASLFKVLEAFANGGTALTGTEAISNGVSVFRSPQSRNARSTLGAVGLILGSLFLGVSFLAALTHAIPFIGGTPTVISQVAQTVYGTGGLGRDLFYLLQTGTLLILVLAANTSFTGFPFLASFAAEDSFLPRQLTRRGHRLVFSNGIIVLTVVSIALLVATQARLTSLISLYAIGVFTGFTMAGAGMVRHHLRHRQPHWKRRVAINGSAAVVSLIVDLVFAVTKFTEGAWLVVLLLPALVFAFIRLNRQYRRERESLGRGVDRAAEARTLRRHVVLVFVDRLDLATARAVQYARTLGPDQLRAVHFVMDRQAAEELQHQWERLGLPERVSLELWNCPGRRLVRDALLVVAQALSDRETEVSVLLPRRAYARGWSRLLHDRTADRIAGQVSRLPHANATIVPFQVEAEPLDSFLDKEAPPPEAGAEGDRYRPVTTGAEAKRTQASGAGAKGAEVGTAGAAGPRPPGTVPIATVEWRHRAKVAGQVESVRVRPWGDTPQLIATVVDETGGLTLVFGRRKLAGLRAGARLVAEGMVTEASGRLTMFNPLIELLASDEEEADQGQP